MLIKENKKFMQEYNNIDSVGVLYRKFTKPEYTMVILRLNNPASTSLKTLFEELNIPENLLKEVCEFLPLRTEFYNDFGGWDFKCKNAGYSGKFRKQGKQNLVDILGKKISFYPTSEGYHFNHNNIETFSPKN